MKGAPVTDFASEFERDGQPKIPSNPDPEFNELECEQCGDTLHQRDDSVYCTGCRLQHEADAA